jgi:hypothetical protein
MGQYYKLVNKDKREVVNAWDLGGGAKFWEWFYNPKRKVLLWLLAQSSSQIGGTYERLGGGDVENDGYETLGRWAGDRVTLVGDYDASNLYVESEQYTDISKKVRHEINCAMRKDIGQHKDWFDEEEL